MRIYDGRLGRWLSTDPLLSKFPYQSPYCSFDNNPVSNIDPDGQFSINNHAAYTNFALKKLGYGDIMRTYISAYASMFADHPPKWVKVAQGENGHWLVPEKSWVKSGKSQDPDIEHNTWHSMKAPGETVTDEAAMARGQAFGWGKIINASNEISKEGSLDSYFDIKHVSTNGMEYGGVKEGINLIGLEDLGQGIHALQDAIAHQGSSLKGGNAKKHSVWNDMFPSKGDIQKADRITSSAILSMEALTGNYKNIKNKMIIDLTGTTVDQYNTIKAAFQKAKESSEGKVKEIYFTRKP